MNISLGRTLRVIFFDNLWVIHFLLYFTAWGDFLLINNAAEAAKKHIGADSYLERMPLQLEERVRSFAS